MLTVRRSEDRGHFDFGWLDTYHTFSFSDYQDPRYMGFRTLRVINEDRVRPGQGFGEHAHRDMEILTYILEGELAHKDSMGNGSSIRPGDAQRMSAGSGVTHSEFNHSKKEPVHLLQIWIFPEKKSMIPSYEQKNFPVKERQDRWCLLASRDGREGSVTIHQDVSIYTMLLSRGKNLKQVLNPSRHAWIQVAKGALDVNGTRLKAGDGAAISEEKKIETNAIEDSECILFDLA